MSNWMPYKELDWDNPAFTAFHIDTRDFNGIGNDHKPKIDFIKKKAERDPDNWFFTKEQIIELLDRYFAESGGPGEWRMFSLTGPGELYTSNWQMKYIRIYRINYGFVIYDEQHNKRLFSKEILNSPVQKDEDILNHH